jgi:spoIIIJ-associated protein
VSELSVEATGETVGEAKWSALRELERRHPGLDKAAVRFQVVSEGERGLLGVGYSPARVVASVPEDAVAPPSRVDEGDTAALVRELVERIVAGIGVEGRVAIEEDEQSIVATVSGHDLGGLIGRHGQTIDAVQYLVSAALYRSGEERQVVVDAAGYRARRQATLESLAVRSAQRALETGEEVALEPMSAVERKIVHTRLADFARVGTRSEGVEPNRYVVVVPD